MRIYLTIKGKTIDASPVFTQENRESEIRALERHIDFRNVTETRDDGKHVTYIGKNGEEYAAIHPL